MGRHIGATANSNPDDGANLNTQSDAKDGGELSGPDSGSAGDFKPTTRPVPMVPVRLAWWREAAILFAKDARAELRTLTAVSAVTVFAVSALLLIGLATQALKGAQFVRDADLRIDWTRHAYTITSHVAWTSDSKMGLLWVLLSFAAFVGLAHSFVHEEETGTTLALRLSMSAGAVYAGKLAFNFVVISAVALLVTPLYMLITGMVTGPPFVFLLVMLCGCAGMAASATIIAALAAKARGTGALFSAIGLPFVVVFLILLIHAAGSLYLVNVSTVRLVRDVGGLASFDILLVAVSAIVFPFVWEE